MTKRMELRVEHNFDKAWKLNPETGCWEWQLGKCKGYGVLKAGGRNVRAYRHSYTLHYGHIAEGAHVLHSCDNKACVNPSHLRLGTHADNMRDKRERFKNWPRGERSHRAKLSRSDTWQIALLRNAGVTQMVLADIFDVTQTAISALLLGKSWSKTNNP